MPLGLEGESHRGNAMKIVRETRDIEKSNPSDVGNNKEAPLNTSGA
jgi:hypothetical protein